MREPDAAADDPSCRHRQLGWEGFHNARDLGGLPTMDGHSTRFGAYVRSAEPTLVTGAGWQAALDAGVRTIVDLRNADEIRPVTGEGPTRLAGTALFPRTTDTAVAHAGCDRWEGGGSRRCHRAP
ncbi:Tyrosine phosphatase family protein [Haloechinothrix alba]|uniref:Tyrosine phosphatase family protein n=1 Tax=Haloechinothrix alba TaxID=664784 RepID=A0A238VNI7_9PSEU|nr:tyrosine-protein phosphatase [Haloechinothrix alba]SNR35925.1 Tyrosine phosphatase family protein [Haloechinothrix alba]